MCSLESHRHQLINLSLLFSIILLWFVLSGLLRWWYYWFIFSDWLGLLFLLFLLWLLFLFLFWLLSKAHNHKEIVLLNTYLTEHISVSSTLAFEYNFLLINIQSLFFLDYLFQIKDLCLVKYVCTVASESI